AEEDLEHFTVTAGVDGVVASLSVTPGTVSEVGTSVWGEIIDPSVVDVRCDLTPPQADRVREGQPAEVFLEGQAGTAWKARVEVIGVAADRATGLVPVLLRLENSDRPPRCYVEVKVRFTEPKNP